VTTARTLIKGALMDLGVSSPEEPIQADMAQHGLDLLNALLDSFSTESLWIYYLKPTELSWPAGVPMQTWGVGGAIPSARPIRLADHAEYRDAVGYDYPVEVLARQEQYAQLAWKTETSTWPLALYYAPQVPLGELYIWPVNAAGPWTITVYPWVPLEAFSSLDDDVQFPPGYTRALRAALALECSPSYGVQPSPLTLKIAEESKRNLAVINTVVGRMSPTPGSGLVGDRMARFRAGIG
jgi:hypothetical protein